MLLRAIQKRTKRKAKSQKAIGKAQSSCKEKRRNPPSSLARKKEEERILGETKKNKKQKERSRS